MQLVKVFRGSRWRSYVSSNCADCSSPILFDRQKLKKENHCKLCTIKKNQSLRWKGHVPSRGTPIKNTWEHMMRRCYSPKTPKYHRYGGRGISVCQEWHDFKIFRAWAVKGWFENATLDRIDNNGNYCPKNCQWLTASENAKKKWRCS
jgi:hypothetical protein